jgi:hypothetical protein
MATKRKAAASSRLPAKRPRAQSDDAPEDVAYGQSVRERAEPYRLGTARFPVDGLTPVWTQGCNRDPDKKQVQALCKIFEEQEVQRESVENRLRVLCSRAEVERMTAHLAQAGEPTSETASSLPSFRDWVKVNGGCAELMAGQHRVKALELFLKRGNRLPSSPESPWWPCDIYDRGRRPLPRLPADDANWHLQTRSRPTWISSCGPTGRTARCAIATARSGCRSRGMLRRTQRPSRGAMRRWHRGWSRSRTSVGPSGAGWRRCGRTSAGRRCLPGGVTRPWGAPSSTSRCGPTSPASE